MIKIIKQAILSSSIWILLFFFKVRTVQAAIVPRAGEDEPDYTLNDLIQVFINIGQWILGIVGSLAILMFVYGGFLFLFSGGNSDRANQGKQTLVNAVIGLFIVFLSYMIVGMVFKFTGVKLPEGTAWSKTGWFTN